MPPRKKNDTQTVASSSNTDAAALFTAPRSSLPEAQQFVVNPNVFTPGYTDMQAAKFWREAIFSVRIIINCARQQNVDITTDELKRAVAKRRIERSLARQKKTPDIVLLEAVTSEPENFIRQCNVKYEPLSLEEAQLAEMMIEELRQNKESYLEILRNVTETRDAVSAASLAASNSSIYNPIYNQSALDFPPDVDNLLNDLLGTDPNLDDPGSPRPSLDVS